MKSSSYVLTPTARKHLREAKAWSLARWGSELTTKYFHDLEKAAHYLASNHQNHATRQELAGGSGLNIYSVREHYIIYEPLELQKIAIVAFIRHGRDIPALLNKHAHFFKRELMDIRKKYEA